jgi:hypothetical protein
MVLTAMEAVGLAGRGGGAHGHGGGWRGKKEAAGALGFCHSSAAAGRGITRGKGSRRGRRRQAHVAEGGRAAQLMHTRPCVSRIHLFLD